MKGETVIKLLQTNKKIITALAKKNDLLLSIIQEVCEYGKLKGDSKVAQIIATGLDKFVELQQKDAAMQEEMRQIKKQIEEENNEKNINI